MGEYEDINDFLKQLNSSLIGDSTIAEANSHGATTASFDINAFLSQQMEEIQTSFKLSAYTVATRIDVTDTVTMVVDSSSDDAGSTAMISTAKVGAQSPSSIKGL